MSFEAGMRRLMILTHRYMGIALSLLFAVWFISGIAMIYARGMPNLTPNLRLQRLAALRPDSVRTTPSAAIQKARLDRSPQRVVLSSVAGRPVFRIGTKTVFADDGELMNVVDASAAIQIAAAFVNTSPDRVHVTTQTEADQWTISQRRQMPLHKITVDDAERTQLYVSPQSGEVVVMTNRAGRALAWIAAIPHWLYFTPLRTRDGLWRQVILWTSGLGCLLVLLGIILTFTQFRVRYRGWMRWHYATGAFFGVFALTWVFSGLLSLDPWNWSLGGGLGSEIRGVLSGGPLNAENFPALDLAQVSSVAGAPIKEVEFSRIQGEPYFVVRTTEKRLLFSAKTSQFRKEPFTVDSLMSLVAKAYPNVPILEFRLLKNYDSYYYSQEGDLPLPVLRVKFGDKDKTWFYIDPETSQLMRSTHRLGRINRWIYHGFHSLDFSFWYYNRPAWDAGVILLSLGGAATSIIGAFLGIRRLRQRLHLYRKAPG